VDVSAGERRVRMSCEEDWASIELAFGAGVRTVILVSNDDADVVWGEVIEAGILCPEGSDFVEFAVRCYSRPRPFALNFRILILQF
jgi:hypothetical protein